MIIVVMGVSGCGKTTIGKLLAKRMDLAFIEGDDFHPPANVAKMRQGAPLDDSDRIPWLRKLALRLDEAEGAGGAVCACSALKKSYRDILAAGREARISFVYLRGSKECVEKRMRERAGHYMPPSLLQSQFLALEEPRDALTVHIDQDPSRIVDEIIAGLPEVPPVPLK
jgi:carbohydrate kinase (thermoresistant glucokinase family)